MNLRRLTFLFGLALVATAAARAEAPPETPHFPESQDAAQIEIDLDAARAAARDQGKLLMVVMGANWCHDSRAFADLLDDPGFAALLADRYVVQKVNVGFYDHVRDVVTRWDIPVIYGTPTVIVLEPDSGMVLNRDTLPHWRNAASLDATDAVDYFDDYRPGPPPPRATPSPALAEALAGIDAFEREQAERIYAAYAVLGELLRELGDDRPGPEFMEKWDNLAAMRSEITVDLAELRAEARKKDQAGDAWPEPVFPEYDLFID